MNANLRCPDIGFRIRRFRALKRLALSAGICFLGLLLLTGCDEGAVSDAGDKHDAPAQIASAANGGVHERKQSVDQIAEPHTAGQETIVAQRNDSHIGGEPRYSRANEDVSELLRNAEQGDAAAQFALGNTYSEEGEQMLHCGEVPCADDDKEKRDLLEYVSKQKLETALFWYLKAAKQGHAGAQYRVGYLSGSGVVVDGKREDAFAWYLASANQGLAEAQDAVGNFYYWGYWFNPAAQPNYSEAFKWFFKAATQGLDQSQVAVAHAYESGRGVEKNRNEALQWYSRAAENGDQLAQKGLGCLLAEGSGAELIDAVKWLEIVDLTSRVDEYDTSCVEKAVSRMTPEQIDRAKKLAREFIKSKGVAAGG